MNYVTTIGEAFRRHIHKIVNESTKYQLESTFYTLKQTLEIISNLHLWSLPHQKRGRKPLSYPETLVSDNDNGIPELVNIIENRNHWK